MAEAGQRQPGGMAVDGARTRRGGRNRGRLFHLPIECHAPATRRSCEAGERWGKRADSHGWNESAAIKWFVMGVLRTNWHHTRRNRFDMADLTIQNEPIKSELF